MVPELVDILTTHELTEALHLPHDSRLLKSLRLLRTSKGNLVIIPNIKCALPLFAVLNGTSNGAGIVRVVNHVPDINSVVKDLACGKSREVEIGRALYVRNHDSIISVCDRGGRCFELSSTSRLTYSNYLETPVIVFCSKKYCVHLDPIERRLVKVKRVFLSTHGSTSCLVAIDDVCRVLLWDKYEGNFRSYEVDGCGMSINRLVCSDNLCTAYSEGEALAISFSGLYSIPKSLKPLISCGANDYFIDENYGVLVRSVGGELDPVAVTGPATPCGCVNGFPVISSSSGIGILNDRIWLIIRSGRYLEASAYSNVIAVRHGSRTEFVVFEESEEFTSHASVTKCVVGKGGLTWCLSGGNLILLNPLKPVKAEIKVLSSKVDSWDYASVTLSPWFPNSSYEISKFVRVISEVVRDKELVLKLRPKQLGWSGTVRIVLRTPVISLSESFNLTSSRPRIKSVEVVDCKYSPDGILKNSDSRPSNTLIKLRVTPVNPVPERGTLEMICRDVRGPKASEYSILIDPGPSERELDIVAASRGDKLEILFNLLYDQGDRYYLGRLSIDLSNYMIPNPLKSIDFILTHVGSETLICSKEDSAVLRLTCYDGRVFEGNSCLVVENCVLPAVLELEAQNEYFIWRQYRILDDVLGKPLLISTPREGEDLKLAHTSSNIGGFIYSNLVVDTSSSTTLIKCVDFELTAPDELVLKYSTDLPSIVVVACGNKIKYADVREGSFKIALGDDCLFRGIRVYAIGPANITDHVLLPFGRLFRALLELAVKTSLKLGSYLGVPR